MRQGRELIRTYANLRLGAWYSDDWIFRFHMDEVKIETLARTVETWSDQVTVGTWKSRTEKIFTLTDSPCICKTWGIGLFIRVQTAGRQYGKYIQYTSTEPKNPSTTAGKMPGIPWELPIFLMRHSRKTGCCRPHAGFKLFLSAFLSQLGCENSEGVGMRDHATS